MSGQRETVTQHALHHFVLEAPQAQHRWAIVPKSDENSSRDQWGFAILEPRIVHTPLDPSTDSWNVPYAGKRHKADDLPQTYCLPFLRGGFRARHLQSTCLKTVWSSYKNKLQ